MAPIKKRKKEKDPEPAWTPPTPIFDQIYLDDDDAEYYYNAVLEENAIDHMKGVHRRKEKGWFYPDEDEPLEGFHIVEDK